MYSVTIRYFWQGNYHIYSQIRCIYAVLVIPFSKAKVMGQLLCCTSFLEQT